MRHTNSLVNVSDAKCPESATRQVDTVSQITASISRMPIRDKSCQKHWAKTIFYKLVIYSDLLNSTGKRVSMGIFPDDLEQVYDNVTKLRQRR